MVLTSGDARISILYRMPRPFNQPIIQTCVPRPQVKGENHFLVLLFQPLGVKIRNLGYMPKGLNPGV